MSSVACFRTSAVLGAMAVALGAFGAHGLQMLLQEHGKRDVWEKAVFYHFIHAVVMLVLSLRTSKECTWRGPWVCFLTGIILFSGSLYALAITNISSLGMITPVGGTAFIAGWVWLALRAPELPSR